MLVLPNFILSVEIFPKQTINQANQWLQYKIITLVDGLQREPLHTKSEIE